MWIAPELESGANVLYLQGRWRLAHVPGIAAEVEALRLAGDHCVLDGSRLEELDTAAGFVLLHRLAELGCIARTVEVRHMAEAHARLLTLVRERMAAPSVAAPIAAPRGARARRPRDPSRRAHPAGAGRLPRPGRPGAGRAAAPAAALPPQGDGVAVRDRDASTRSASSPWSPSSSASSSPTCSACRRSASARRSSSSTASAWRSAASSRRSSSP